MRAAEIRKAASEPLLEFVANHGKEVAIDTGGSLLVNEIMLQADGGTYFRNCCLWLFFDPTMGVPNMGKSMFG